MNSDLFGAASGSEYPPELNGEAWDLWLAYRRKRRLPKYVTDGKMRELMVLPHDVQMACVQHSMNNTYQGLFPEKFNEKSRRPCQAIQRETATELIHSLDW